MCGIFGYISKKEQVNIWSVLEKGLRHLEYRGYDSTGVAIFDADTKGVEIVKSVGSVDELKAEIENGQYNLLGNIGIGHTRWATNEEPILENCHPHFSKDYVVVGIYNGTVNNHVDIKAKLESEKYSFYSNSDTELIINLIDFFYNKYKDQQTAIRKTLLSINGSVALGVVFKDSMDKIWFAKKESSLIIALNENNEEAYLSSDTLALTEEGLLVYPLRTNEFGYITADNLKIFNLDDKDVTADRQPFSLANSKTSSGKGKFQHFLLKEIEEQPKAIRSTINKYVYNKDIHLGIPNSLLVNLDNLYFVGSGSSFNASLVGEYLANRFFHYINTKSIIASEFIFKADQLRKDKSLVIFLSQSGETQDTLVALEYCKLLGIPTLAIVNVKTSRLATEADYVLFTQAFPELSMATTKAYTCQLILLYLLGIKVKYLKLLQKREVTLEFANSILEQYIQIIRQLPKYMEDIIKDQTDIQKLAAELTDKKNLLLVGGTEFPTCAEGALKLKEICGIYAEALPIGELKHGSLGLIDSDMYVILISTQSNNTHEISGAAEIKTRGGKLISILSKIDANKILESTSDYIFNIPNLKEGSQFSQPLATVYLQLLAYYIAVHKGINPDKPRNLARSVVVE